MHKVSDSIRSTHGQDGAIMLDIQQGHMFNLNVVGSRILELMEHGESEATIVAAISKEFSADADVVRRDLGEFLRNLEQHGLIHECQSDGLEKA